MLNINTRIAAANTEQLLSNDSRSCNTTQINNNNSNKCVLQATSSHPRQSNDHPPSPPPQQQTLHETAELIVPPLVEFELLPTPENATHEKPSKATKEESNFDNSFPPPPPSIASSSAMNQSARETNDNYNDNDSNIPIKNQFVRKNSDIVDIEYENDVQKIIDKRINACNEVSQKIINISLVFTLFLLTLFNTK